jgi:hypothetical protein
MLLSDLFIDLLIKDLKNCTFQPNRFLNILREQLCCSYNLDAVCLKSMHYKRLNNEINLFVFDNILKDNIYDIINDSMRISQPL